MKGHRDRHCALIRQLLHNPVTAFLSNWGIAMLL
jgi:hypothetical protein